MFQQSLFYLLSVEMIILILLLINTPLRPPIVKHMGKLKRRHCTLTCTLYNIAVGGCLSVIVTNLYKIFWLNKTTETTILSVLEGMFVMKKDMLQLTLIDCAIVLVVVDSILEYLWAIRVLRKSREEKDEEIVSMKKKLEMLERIYNNKVADLRAEEWCAQNSLRPEDFLFKNSAYWSSHSDIY